MNRRRFLRVGILGTIAAAFAPLLRNHTPAVADPAEAFALGGEWIPHGQVPMIGEQPSEHILPRSYVGLLYHKVDLGDPAVGRIEEYTALHSNEPIAVRKLRS